MNARDLDPELREFALPDFGFSDDLNHYGDQNISVWQLLFDYVKTYPKYERLKNLVHTKTYEKIEKIRK